MTDASKRLQALREQIKQGFERRDEGSIKKIFDKFAVGIQHPPALSKQQFHQALEHLQFSNAKDMDDMFKIFDINEDESIDFEEFKQVLQTPSQVEEWTKSLPLHHMLADALPRSDKKTQESNIDDLKELTSLQLPDLSDVITAFSEGLRVLLEKGLQDLKHGIEAALDSTKKDTKKERSTIGKFSVFTMNAGLIDDFHAGLSGRIGVQAHYFVFLHGPQSHSQ